MQEARDYFNINNFVSLVREVVRIIEKSKFNLVELKKNTDFMIKVKNIDSLIGHLTHYNYFTNMPIITFSEVKGTGKKKTHLIGLMLTVSVAALILLLMLNYIISAYFSKPGLQYTIEQYNFLSKLRIFSSVSIGAIILFIFLMIKRIVKPNKKIGISDYYDFLKSLENQLVLT